MANEKMTKREVLNAIVSFIENGGNISIVDPEVEVEDNTEAPVININDEVKAYALNEINLLDKKAEKAKGVQSRTQKENEGIKAIIIEVLNEVTEDKPITVGELIKDVRLAEKEVSNQKASALLKQLVEAGSVYRITDKKKALFTTRVPEEKEANEE